MARLFSGASYCEAADQAPIDITGTVVVIAFWVKRTSTGNFPHMVAKGTAGTGVQYKVFHGGSTYYFEIGDSGGVDQCSSPGWSTGVWEHVVAVKNGTGAGAQKMYRNGVFVGTATSNKSIQNTANTLRVGQASDGSQQFAGTIAEVGIWDVVLSDAEILALAAGVSPRQVRPGSLKGYWPLYGAGSPEPDLSGNQNNMTVSSAAAADHAPVGAYVKENQ